MKLPRFILLSTALALSAPMLWAMTYDAWALYHFDAVALSDLTISGSNADPDGDGLTNLLEYAFDTDPGLPDSTGQTPAWLDETGHLTLAYSRLYDHPGIVYLPQVTSDLRGPWLSGPQNLEETQAAYRSYLSESVTIRDTQPGLLQSQRFIRLLIALDSDGDGLPDEWELARGLNPFNPFDALLDTDGDGITNADEFAAGTDPLDRYNGSRRTGIPAAPRNLRVQTHDDGSRDVYWESASDNETYFVIREHLPNGSAVELGRVGAGETHLHVPAPGGD